MLGAAALLRQSIPPLRLQHGLNLLLMQLLRRCLRDVMLREALPMWWCERRQAPAATPPKLRCLRVTPLALQPLLAVAALLADRARHRVSRPLIRVLL
jgi:hypothetical protein